MNYSEHRFESNDGLSLYYREYGSGDNVVVCLPGLTRNCRDFEDLSQALIPDWRVITPDLRGRGRSDHDTKPANYHPGTYVKDTWRLLDTIGVERVALIGTSLGGLMAMIMADQQPSRLRGIVINDAGPEVPDEAVARILEYVGRVPPADNWTAAATAAKRNYGLAFPDVPDSFWLDWVKLAWIEGEDGRPRPDFDAAIGDAMRNAQGAIKWLRRFRRWGLLKRVAGVPIDSWDAFRAVSMPCLLLRGALSDVLTSETVGKMQAAKPDLEVVTVPNRGHAPVLDEPTARQAIIAFLARLA